MCQERQSRFLPDMFYESNSGYRGTYWLRKGVCFRLIGKEVEEKKRVAVR